MAIRGKSYIKTSWAFQERPVASAKFNTWDDRIEAALELLMNLASLAWGGGDGVLRNATAGGLAVSAASPPAMAVSVAPGYAFIARFPFHLASEIVVGGIAAPGSAPRIDLVQARIDSWDVIVKPGSESPSPAPPEPDAECLPLAELYLRPGMTAVLDIDDGLNGYISDARTYV